MSEMGSVIMVLPPSPARLDHTRNLTAKCVEPQANTAQFELAVVRATATAHLAAVSVPNIEFRGAIELRKLTRTRHLGFPLLTQPGKACPCAGGARAPLRPSSPKSRRRG